VSRRSAKIRRHGGNQGQSKPVIPRPAHQGSRRGGLGAMLGHALTGLKSRLPTLAVVAVVALGAGIIITRFLGGPTQGVVVAVEVPGLSPTAERGKLAYDANCAQCHGENGAGTDLGPSLIHDIYNPGHHADAAFFAAAQRGVQRHHWPFGDMPPQPQVGRREVETIVRYFRELQEANGIFFRPHRM
jgi:mono/diheme cytochrome c family protein